MEQIEVSLLMEQLQNLVVGAREEPNGTTVWLKSAYNMGQ
jgi:hypothetical protein